MCGAFLSVFDRRTTTGVTAWASGQLIRQNSSHMNIIQRFGRKSIHLVSSILHNYVVYFEKKKLVGYIYFDTYIVITVNCYLF